MKTFFNLIFVLLLTHTASAQLFVQSTPPLDQSNNIRNYLMRVASEVTHNSLAGIHTIQDWKNVRDQRYQEFLEMLSLTDVPLEGERPPLNVKVVDEIQQDGYKIIKLYYESLPDLYVPADLYIPDDITDPVPAVLYVCGHSRTQKVHYQAHPRHFAKLGFVSLIVETIQWGEVYGHHWGCYAEGNFHWYSRGYTPGGVELWNAIRGIDLLVDRPEVDGSKIGVTGISGGGAVSWYTGAADPRVKAVAPVCGNGTVEGHVHQHTVDGHCDCMMPINTKLIDFHDIGALIAPKPLLVAAANRDGLYSIESIRTAYNNVERIYHLYGADENVSFVETPGGHSYHEISRTKIFSFFIKHLMGKDVPPSETGDIDESDEAMLSVDELRIYVDGPPADDRTTTIQDSFQNMAEAPSITSQAEWNAYKDNVVAFLKENTFKAFPQDKCELSIRREFRADDSRDDYSFVPEEGFRLPIEISMNSGSAEGQGVVVVLRNPNEKRWASEGFSNGIPNGWTRAYFSARGIGESSWSPGSQWHLRRAAAWTGRTIASMRVYDVLRCLETVRQLPGVDKDRIALAARGEMAAVALYAALLDGNLHSLIIANAPPTQNAPSNPDGTGEAIEMLNCLRVTDLPQVAGILAPTKVYFIGKPHENYEWAKQTMAAVGKGDMVEEISNMRGWSGE